MDTQQTISLALESLTHERNSVYLYKIIAQCSLNKTHYHLFEQLAEEAHKQSLLWEKEISSHGGALPDPYEPALRVLIVGWGVKRFGPRAMRSILSAMKIRGMSVYSTQDIKHPMPQNVSEIGRRHQSNSSGNNLRAAVFGVNDGLISNASIIMGMAGGQVNNQTLILAGFAGLFAGAFSMAVGEFVSVRSQREMFEYQINLEKKELELYPEEETAELALIYHARGLSVEEANNFARKIMSDPKTALDTLARDELGLDPNHLVSPYSAAFFSFLSFMIGAFIPLLPFLLLHQYSPISFSIGLTLLCLFIVGAALSIFTGCNAVKNGLRMLLIGSFAGAITFLIGNILGVTIG